MLSNGQERFSARLMKSHVSLLGGGQQAERGALILRNWNPDGTATRSSRTWEHKEQGLKEVKAGDPTRRVGSNGIKGHGNTVDTLVEAVPEILVIVLFHLLSSIS